MANLKRCINIDWLEVFCTESAENYPHDADYFRSCGYFVSERDYGTRQYTQMFTILDKDDLPFIEIRRDPVSGDKAKRVSGIFNPYSCHVRLVNRYCYHESAVGLFSEFLLQHGYIVNRLYRLDLCLDFERFDKGDDPADVLKRYVKRKYTKINQCEVDMHGKEQWDSLMLNSISWGSPTSMVKTRFYNKSLELKEVRDKPYIRYAWMAAGLVDDFVNLTKRKADGSVYTPTIWRVEFAIKSAARGWYSYEDNSGRKERVLRAEHSLATYATKRDQLKAFAFLSSHYFHFKIFQQGVRKDRCPDKVLFDFGFHECYTLDRLMSSVPKETALETLQRRLRTFQITHPDKGAAAACKTIIDYIDQLRLRSSQSNYYDRNERALLQLLVSRRLEGLDNSFVESLEHVKALLSLADGAF